MRVYWFEQTRACLAAGTDWLTPLERGCFSAMVSPKRRADWLLGRWTAKRSLCRFLPRQPQEIEIRAGSSGAPEVWCEGRLQDLTISLSHRLGRACCALAHGRTDLGCDIEANEHHSPAFVRDYFTASEQRWIADADADGRKEGPALLWSAKESALKALGVGLRESTLSIAVQEYPYDSWPCISDWGLLHLRYRTRELYGWWRADGDFVRTVVADPPADVPIECPPDHWAIHEFTDWSKLHEVVQS